MINWITFATEVGLVVPPELIMSPDAVLDIRACQSAPTPPPLNVRHYTRVPGPSVLGRADDQHQRTDRYLQSAVWGILHVITTR